MAGLCEGGNEPPGSLKATKWTFLFQLPPREVRLVIKFLNAQGIAPIEIDRQLCQVYGPNVMSKEMVRCSTRSLVYRSSTRVCVRICVSIRRPEYECSGPQLEGPEFECSGPQLEGRQ
ncbi:hypothetical protein ANN_23597 [Periplaneta americana]|uniref:Uncharacterized protein n=1 Tax=Periplaneta americana TaxID=6978 RepID=A0ABQ8SLJ3_PERAM|nr:hypothetical protein ANN_23597 [Periplaneta americana]